MTALAVVVVTGAAVAAGQVLPSGEPCELRVDGGQDVGVSRAAARSATSLAAVALRDGARDRAVAAAVDRVLSGGAEVSTETAPDALAEAARSAPATGAARAVLGREQGALTCRAEVPQASGQVAGASGLTPRAVRLRTALEEAFGRQSLGGFAPGGVRTGHVEGSAHYDGRALDVFFRPVTAKGTASGWALAHWAVAHASELDVTVVIYDRQIWSAGRSSQGWRDYEHPSGDTDNPVLAHEDHVHVEVAR